MSAFDPTGHYSIGDWSFTVLDRDGALIVATPGVPDGTSHASTRSRWR